MRGRPILCSVLAAHAAVVFAPQAPSLSACVWISASLAGLAALVSVARRFLSPVWSYRAGTFMWVLIAAIPALLFTAQRVVWRLEDALTPAHVDRVTRVTLRVIDLPQRSPASRRFAAQVLSAHPQGVPQHILVSWFAPGRRSAFSAAEPWPFPNIVPGQVWRMALNLRPPAGERNPDAFDAEAHWFAQGIRAMGSVRGTPLLIADAAWVDVETSANRVRHHIRAAMQPYVERLRYGAVLTALAIGDQAGVAPADWLVFKRSGIIHLVSISGSHITLLAVLAAVVVRWGWVRVRLRRRWLAERIPAPLAGVWAALAVAWCYCLLAGWGVPARRTFIMLAVLALAYTARLPLLASRVLLAAAVVVVVLDPWALMASGFWLSFGAVAVLLAVGGWEGWQTAAQGGRAPPAATRALRWLHLLGSATRLQLSISLALMPLLARLFHEISLVSPLANAYAIPIVGFLITPLALLLAALACIPGLEWAAHAVAWAAHSILSGMMQVTQWLAALPIASLGVAAVPWGLTLLALAGMTWALLPTGGTLRHAAWLLILPALLWQAEPPAVGDWRLTVLDTGQSGAALLQTHTHTLLFDTGKRVSPDVESGSRTIVPLLRSLGVRQLDTLVVSHADLDHVGGASGVLRAVPVRQSFSSFDLPAWLAREAQLLGHPADVAPLPQQNHACTAGQHWEVDGVAFIFLWPRPQASAPGQAHNANSCVLLVRGTHHAVLFSGDIGAEQEQHILAAHGLTAVDVVLLPHHGSRFSSSAAFISTTHPSHVIAQAGLWNPFGHPHAQTIARWQRAGATVWRTDLDGAVHVQSTHGVLSASGLRSSAPHYWSLPVLRKRAGNVTI